MTVVATLVDAGPLVALLSKSQIHHLACVEAFSQLGRPLMTCWPVLTEAAHLLRHRHELVTSLLHSAQGRFLQVLPLEESDVDGINHIRNKYRDQHLDLADACLMYLADREGIKQVLTQDRDFRVYHLSDGNPL